MIIAAIAGALATTSQPPQVDLDTVYGRWMTQDHQSIIQIYDCGNQTPCGQVIWVDGDPDGLKKDIHNRNKAHRDRSILGMVLLNGFKSGKKDWNGGTIYNPEDGKSYRAKLKTLDNGNLQVKGCVGPICRQIIWQPAPQSQD